MATNEHRRQFTADDLDNRFEYHPPRSAARAGAHTTVRTACKDVARQFNEFLPDGREKAVVMTRLEEVMFWANAALARSMDEEEGTDAGSA